MRYSLDGDDRMSCGQSYYPCLVQHCVCVRAVGGYIRPPDLQEVIDYLNYPDDSVKANAAAYLQHLSYNDDGIKAKTR